MFSRCEKPDVSGRHRESLRFSGALSGDSHIPLACLNSVLSQPAPALASFNSISNGQLPALLAACKCRLESTGACLDLLQFCLELTGACCGGRYVHSGPKVVPRIMYFLRVASLQ